MRCTIVGTFSSIVRAILHSRCLIAYRNLAPLLKAAGSPLNPTNSHQDKAAEPKRGVAPLLAIFHPVFRHFSETNKNIAFIPGDDIVCGINWLPLVSRGYGRCVLQILQSSPPDHCLWVGLATVPNDAQITHIARILSATETSLNIPRSYYKNLRPNSISPADSTSRPPPLALPTVVMVESLDQFISNTLATWKSVLGASLCMPVRGLVLNRFETLWSEKSAPPASRSGTTSTETFLLTTVASFPRYGRDEVH